MMNSRAMLRLLLAAVIGLFGLLGFTGQAVAQTCNNANSGAQDDICTNGGDADGEATQDGSASSGDGVAGQVAGVVSAGDASVDATNRSDDVSVGTGDAEGTNDANVDVDTGVFGGAGTCNNTNNAGGTQADSCTNSGDADGAASQSADAASGDGVGGQVIGVVTSAGGSADLVLDNESTDSSVDTGSAEFNNGSQVSSTAVTFNVL